MNLNALKRKYKELENRYNLSAGCPTLEYNERTMDLETYPGSWMTEKEFLSASTGKAVQVANNVMKEISKDLVNRKSIPQRFMLWIDEIESHVGVKFYRANVMVIFSRKLTEKEKEDETNRDFEQEDSDIHP